MPDETENKNTTRWWWDVIFASREKDISRSIKKNRYLWLTNPQMQPETGRKIIEIDKKRNVLFPGGARN